MATLELRNDYGGPRVDMSPYGGGAALMPSVRQLETDAAELRRVEARVRSTVQQLRAGGASWAVIGHAIGISKQAAQQRYGRDVLV